jgi:hypothetical protein
MNWRLEAADGNRRSDGRYSRRRSPFFCRRDNCPNGPIAGNSFTGIPAEFPLNKLAAIGRRRQPSKRRKILPPPFAVLLSPRQLPERAYSR